MHVLCVFTKSILSVNIAVVIQVLFISKQEVTYVRNIKTKNNIQGHCLISNVVSLDWVWDTNRD